MAQAPISQTSAAAKDKESDTVLMQRYCEEDDARAFEDLYARHHPRITAFLRSRIADASLREDLLQAVWLKFHRLRHRYNPKTPVLAWLFVITRSLWIDSLRSHRAHAEKLDPEAELDSIPAPTPAPEENFPELPTSLATLSPRERALIELRIFQEQDYEVICQQLGLSASNVRQTLRRALLKLRKSVLKGKPDHENKTHAVP